MLKFKYIFIALALLLLASYFLFQEKNVQTSVEALNVAVNNIKTADKMHSDVESASSLAQSNGYCAEFEHATKTNTNNRADFISAKAISWYFDGNDKYKIAETLAATFSYSVAINWLNSINALSRNQVKHAQLIQTVDSFNYHSDFVTSSTYMQSISHYQLETFSAEKFDINQRFNEFPDLAEHHWNTALRNALQKVDFVAVIGAINKLKVNIHNPLYFQHPLKKLSTLYLISSFSQPEIEKIIIALFDLSPIFIDVSDSALHVMADTLKGMGISKNLWNFKYIAPNMFNADLTVIQLIENLENKQTLLKKRPTANNICAGEKVNISTINVNKLNTPLAINSLSPSWQGVYASYCANKSYLNYVMAIEKKLQTGNILFRDLGSFKNLQKHSSTLEKTIEQLDEQEKTMLFNILYVNKTFEFEQVKALINSAIAPTNSDFYMLIHRLSIEQQKKLLLEHRYKLTPSNAFKRSIVFYATELAINHDEIIPFLIDQGFPLKQSESSPDPLWLMLYMMSVQHKNELPIKTISALIDHTVLNSTHVDAMYKIKNNNIALYENLLEEFPELKFDAPEELIEMNCNQ